MQQSVFLKMSEREYSDSEFYYRGELSDAEILQLPPTHNEATEKVTTLERRSNAAMRVSSFPQKKWKCKKRWSYDNCRTGKYLALGQDARTSS